MPSRIVAACCPELCLIVFTSSFLIRKSCLAAAAKETRLLGWAWEDYFCCPPFIIIHRRKCRADMPMRCALC